MDEPDTPDETVRLDATPESRRLVSGNVILELHDASRFISLTCDAPGRVTEEDARAFAPPIAEWLDSHEGRVHILVDCTEIRGSDAGWRSLLYDTLSPRRHRLRIAWFGMNSLIAITAKMFITALSTTGTFDGKVFKQRDDAMQWLERDVG